MHWLTKQVFVVSIYVILKPYMSIPPGLSRRIESDCFILQFPRIGTTLGAATELHIFH